MQGDTDSVLSGGDEFITYSFNTWASYLSDGFTEFIEVEVDDAVYIESVIIGEVRGQFAVVGLKAWDDSAHQWQSLYSGTTNSTASAVYAANGQYHNFTPCILTTTFNSSIITIELEDLTSPCGNY